MTVTSRPAHTEDMDKNWNGYARTGIATYFTAHRGGTEGTGKGKMTLNSAELLHEHGVENMGGSTRENTDPRKY